MRWVNECGHPSLLVFRILGEELSRKKFEVFVRFGVNSELAERSLARFVRWGSGQPSSHLLQKECIEHLEIE